MAILHTELCTSYAVRYVVQIGCLVTSGSDDGVGRYSKRWLHESFVHIHTLFFICQIWAPKLLQACFAAITDYATYNLGKRVINQTIAPYIVRVEWIKICHFNWAKAGPLFSC